MHQGFLQKYICIQANACNDERQMQCQDNIKLHFVVLITYAHPTALLAQDARLAVLASWFLQGLEAA